jgi:hypothetical protein
VKAAGWALSFYMDPDGRAEVSRVMLADAAGLHLRTLVDALGRLEGAGLVSVDRAIGRGHVSRYAAIVPGLNGGVAPLFETGKRWSHATNTSREKVAEDSVNGGERPPGTRRSKEDLSGAPGRAPADARARERASRVAAIFAEQDRITGGDP